MMKIFVGIPAYNAEATIGDVISRIKKNKVEKIIVVDDCSSDACGKIAKDLGAIVIKHDVNKGYGGAQKTIYNNFLKLSREDDVIVLVHSDGQTDPKEISLLVRPFYDSSIDVVLGSRSLSNTKKNMPVIKRIGDRFLTKIQNWSFGMRLSTYTSGYRAFRHRALKKVDLIKFVDGHRFDTDILLACNEAGLKMMEVPISAIYAGEKSHFNLVKYSIQVLLKAIKYKVSNKRNIKHHL